MKVVVCAYREWAKRVVPSIRKHPRVDELVHVTSNEELWPQINGQGGGPRPALVLFCGWSTAPPKHFVDAGVPMVSEHPATSDRYSPGTPLQNQILDGLRYTKHRIVKVGFPELAPRQWSHEVDMDLSGNMDDILYQMEATSVILFNKFLDAYPNIEWKEWPLLPEAEQVARRVPEQSRLTRSDLGSLSTRELYDRIRCLEDPYPNAYIEDEHGRLYFQRVRFKANG